MITCATVIAQLSKHGSYTHEEVRSFMHMTFVKLDDTELELVHQFRRVLQAAGVKNPSTPNVIRGIIRDYCHMVEERADPDFLASYREARKPSRKPQQ